MYHFWSKYTLHITSSLWVSLSTKWDCDTTGHWHSNLKQAQTLPPVQRRLCIPMWGPSVSLALLCGGLESHWGQSGSGPSSPAALGNRTDLRTVRFYSPTCTNTQKHFLRHQPAHRLSSSAVKPRREETIRVSLGGPPLLYSMPTADHTLCGAEADIQHSHFNIWT